MCLITYQKKVDIAETNIICWKILEIIKRENDELVITPYAFKPVSEEILSGKLLFTPDDICNYEFENAGNGHHIVDYGFIHTYAEFPTYYDFYHLMSCIGKPEPYILSDKAHELKCKKRPEVSGILLYKCEIPAGTQYLIGTTGGLVNSYASTSLRFIQKAAEFRECLGYDSFMSILTNHI